MVDWLISRFEGPSSPGLYYLLHYIYIYICFTFCYISTLKSTRIIGHSATAFLRACNFCVFRSWLLENMLSENFALFLSLGSTGMINQQIFETVRALQNFLIILNVINCFHGFFRFQHFRVQKSKLLNLSHNLRWEEVFFESLFLVFYYFFIFSIFEFRQFAIICQSIL